MNELGLFKQGEDVPFQYDRGGESISGWTCNVTVKQYPGGPTLVSRAITATDGKFKGFLTQSETSGFGVGLHYLIGKLSNTTTDEEEVIESRFHIGKAWS